MYLLKIVNICNLIIPFFCLIVYFNNSVKTVALANMRSTLDYRVITEVQGNPVNVGDVVVYDKQVNGFKIAFTGSAKSVTVRCFVQGGGTV